MAFEPTYPGGWQDAPDTTTPITAAALNGIDAAISANESAIAGKADATHEHSASDITSGTFSTARIPAIAQSKVTGLSAALDAKADASALADLVARVEALEAAAPEA